MSDPPVINAVNFSKTFSGRTVLSNADMELRPGEVRGLLGQNGSGKSTFIKLLTGVYHPDPGAEVEIRGEQVRLPMTAQAARNHGTSCVHQDLGLIRAATVVENLRIGRYETRRGRRIAWANERVRTQRSLESFGLGHVSPDAVLKDLPEVERAIIAILRSVEEVSEHDRGLLILDEPTPYLPRDSVDRLFEAVASVSSLGHSVLFVSHNLEEAQQLTDTLTILRDGYVIDNLTTADVTEDEIITAILGFSLGELYPETHTPTEHAVFSADNISGASVNGFSCDVSRGEILGLTGLLGMGHEDVPYLFFGATRGTGSITVDGVPIALEDLSPRRAIEAGLALLPGDRKTQGGVAIASAMENVTLPTLASDFISGVLRPRREKRRSTRMLAEFSVVPPEPERILATFSGGNQQKLLVAKWFESRPAVFLLHEPTHGVDVGSRKIIFQSIRDAAESGTAFIMISTEFEDLAHLCDRVLVFRHGRVAATLTGAELTTERILEQCLRQ
ncbi:MAG: sugar ABC transporter ATP-binding protein [Acidimicrobiia bacterium]|nr:sugar ABC transporter ATP-binding protein [Acidimicrobiia bacterium]